MDVNWFRQNGFPRTLCPGDAFCSPLPHAHFDMMPGVEYCPVARTLLINVGVPGVGQACDVPGLDVGTVATAVLAGWKASGCQFPLTAIHLFNREEF